ncbi:unnamed protein product [Nezara viridula]|uniref:Uncharacterized protein n=1 Tax=Nezara viridula TaxID=85310 RepID=A0A9P0H5K9_NEZVI|nr:unnamed protein product [Nezara viridula]
MYVIVYTVTMTVGDLELCADFYHSLIQPSNNRLRMRLLGKQFAVKRLNKNMCMRDQFNYCANFSPHLKHRIRAINLRQLPSDNRRSVLSRNSVKENICRPIVSSTNVPKEESSPQQEIISPPDSPAQAETNCSPRADWGPAETSLWLQANRYTGHHNSLASYSGADLLRLSREDLIQLCGLSDGIRLFNALHVRAVAPKLTIYICVDPRDRVYNVVYLSSLKTGELLRKVCYAVGLPVSQVTQIYLLGPGDIKILPTEELVSHLPDNTAYSVTLISDGQEKYQVLLKQSETVNTISN